MLPGWDDYLDLQKENIRDNILLQNTNVSTRNNGNSNKQLTIKDQPLSIHRVDHDFQYKTLIHGLTSRLTSLTTLLTSVSASSLHWNTSKYDMFDAIHALERVPPCREVPHFDQLTQSVVTLLKTITESLNLSLDAYRTTIAEIQANGKSTFPYFILFTLLDFTLLQ